MSPSYTLLPLQFFAQTGRMVIPIEPDGSCFFRAISYQLFGTQDYHVIVRTTLERAEHLNKKIFENLLMDGRSIDEHLKHLAIPHSWATQVEVVAAASVFQVPLYYCEKKNSVYKWNVVKALTDKNQRELVKCPVLPELDDSITLTRPTHFELLYSNSHYDAIASTTTGTVPTTPPILSSTLLLPTDFYCLIFNCFL